MKTLFFFAGFLFFVFPAVAQVTDTGNNVGIGTTSPSSKLEVKSDANKNSEIHINTTTAGDKSIIRFQDAGTETWGFLSNYPVSGKFSLYNYQNNSNAVVLNQNGNVGIGTTNPRETLEVNGSLVVRAVNLDGKNLNYMINSRLMLIGWNRSQGDGETNFISNRGAGPIGGFDFRDINNSGVETILMKIRGDGNVGIGTTTPDAKLTVAGNIHSREVKVTVNAGADFVFEDNYNLLTLEEVQQFINENGHLPEIASAKDMETNGIHLAEMNIKLLQKIEELTLYVIEQEEKLKIQEGENKELKKVILELKEHSQKVEELENKVNQLINTLNK